MNEVKYLKNQDKKKLELEIKKMTVVRGKKLIEKITIRVVRY